MSSTSSSATAADGTVISYVDHRPVTGPDTDAPPVVLVHGITERGAAWDPVVELLVEAGERVVVPDLRGHGDSGNAASYDLASLAGDVVAVLEHAGIGLPGVRLVGHSLGGTVVSVLASSATVRSTVNVDQSLQLGAFQSQLLQLAPMLRDPDTFAAAMDAIFVELTGDVLGADARGRLAALRRPVQEVVLAIWEPVLESTPEELSALVEAAAGSITCPYLSLHGIDPGPGYGEWLMGLVPNAVVEVWDGLGHYPHLVDPERFVARLVAFWALE